jgi:phosphopantothenoylcysteine decarboxylase/phosphopantothenate--cysteine ligase
MEPVNPHKVLVGVSGGIAAYKSADLCRRLRERGLAVRVVMTRGAQAFITPLTLQAVSGEPVRSALLDEQAEAGMGHIELARWADLVLVAPASANLIARLAAGMADDLLSTVVLATPAPVLLAPAMNQQMWRADATQENLARLRARGVAVLGPGSGDQACGDVGPGRMLEPLELADTVAACLQRRSKLAGTSVLITAGPTREAIDPVRFISNHSSGKMGYALARAASEAGASVTLVSGPTALPQPAGVQRLDVESAQEMLEAVMQRAPECRVFIAAAAVADYRPAQTQPQKIKKLAERTTLSLDRTTDILAEVAALPSPPFTVGFAAETQNVADNARDKLERKRLDMIAANQVGVTGQGFNADNNALRVLWRGGEVDLALTDKLSLARQLVDLIAERLSAVDTA